MKYLLYTIVILFVSCNTEQTRKIKYEDLPNDVKNKFQNIYNYVESPKILSNDTIWYMPPFSECYNLNTNCDCKVYSQGGVIRDAFFLIESCNRRTKIPWDNLQRVFVIKNDSIYFPISQNGTTSAGKSRAYNIKIDTLKFTVKKMD